MTKTDLRYKEYKQRHYRSDREFGQARTSCLGIVIMGLLTFIIKPLIESRKLPVREDIENKTSPEVKIIGSIVMAAVVVFKLIFW